MSKPEVRTIFSYDLHCIFSVFHPLGKNDQRIHLHSICPSYFIIRLRISLIAQKIESEKLAINIFRRCSNDIFTGSLSVRLDIARNRDEKNMFLIPFSAYLISLQRKHFLTRFLSDLQALSISFERKLNFYFPGGLQANILRVCK